VEVADSAKEQSRGLMGRREVPDGTGMLFRFNEKGQRHFWMRDTLVPLDIAWIRDGTVVGVTSMTPCRERDADACRRYPSPGPVEAALEAAPGTFDAVEPGALVQVSEP
jgi:uncharacterized protein